MAVVGALIVVGSISSMSIYGIHPLGRNLAGLGLFTFALVPSRFFVFSGLAPIGRLSFGVYLAHPLVIGACKSVAHISGQAQRWWMDLAVFAAAFVGSYLLTLLLRNNHWTKRLIP